MNKITKLAMQAIVFYMLSLTLAEHSNAAELRVMTQNVWPGFDYQGNITFGYLESHEARAARYQALVHEIKQISPDVISINEANLLPEYAEKLAKELDYDFIEHISDSGLRIGGFNFPTNFRAGDILLAKKSLKLEFVGRKQLSGGKQEKHWSWNFDDGTQVLVGKVTLDGKEIYVATTHAHFSLPQNNWSLNLMNSLTEQWNYSDEQYSFAKKQIQLDSDRRSHEFKQIVAYLKQVIPNDAAQILMGDFNAEADWAEMTHFYQAGYYDTYRLVNDSPGYTWDNKLNVNIKNLYSADLEKKYDSLYEHLTAHADFVRWRIDFILANF